MLDSSGGVTLAAAQATYAPDAAIEVVLVNGLAVSLYTTDHQTSCTIISLRRQTPDGWESVGECRMMRASRLIEVAAGATVRVALAPGAGMLRATPWPPGTYRAALRYTLTPQGAGDALTLESVAFVVA